MVKKSIKSVNNELAQNYQKKNPREHCLDAPDTYIGSIEKDEIANWTLDGDSLKFKKYMWIPGLYKCFDEAIVNSRDHVIRLKEKIKNGEKKIKPVTYISVEIDRKTNIISITNDGNGIDIAEHPEHKLWIPEMIFAHLMTSTNYDKTAKKTVGGKNGFGIKLALIFSTWGKLETIDHVRKKKYVQEYTGNLSKIHKPKITKSSAKPYTKISFLLDFKRFGIENITDDIYYLLKKRTYDIGAITSKEVRVTFNKTVVPCRNFEQYIDLCIGNKIETPRIYLNESKRWEYAVCLTPRGEFTQLSFVNGIYTAKGGKHIEYILNQLIRKISAYILKKKKISVKPSTIKEQLMLFVNCVIENPGFDSQTKEFLTTPISKFGSKCNIPDEFIDKIIKKLGVMETAISLTEIKENKAAKKLDGRKTNSIRGIPKLMDANKAGTTKSHLCTLILTEGDSAKAGVISGLSKEDRNFYGVYPLKGKLLNVLDTLQSKINSNNEITEIKKIMGLETAYEYKSLEEIKKKLRYGKIRFMTDQDLDGSHIKGLGLNLFHSQWHGLIKISSFLGYINTPIIKASKGKTTKSFYYEKDYHTWKKTVSAKGWKIKYFKGLGTSTSKEFKEYFINKKEVIFEYGGADCDNAMDKVFNKKRADDRKIWLGNYNRGLVLNPNNPKVNYQDFIDQEFIHFSKYDCERSIPNIMDGLKTSTRKIMFSAFKRNLVKEIKVAQFAGYVSEHSGYHHGEKSLTEAIIKQAQEFVGSNNIALLMPNGQFGTRLKGGKDHASERYIFTALNPITKLLFRESDRPILTYLNDDGLSIEPEFYAPIIPMILVNGTKGIGTGFSTDVICYNPLDIIQYLKRKLKDKKTLPNINPYYEGFKGEIRKISPERYLLRGCYKITGTDRINITELPIGTWTEEYKGFLETLMGEVRQPKKGGQKKKKIAKQIIKSFTDLCTDSTIHFSIVLCSGIMNEYLPKQSDYGCNKLEKILRLYTTKKITNMHLFDTNQRLKKYKSAEEIIEAYYPTRLELFQKRKDNQIKTLSKIVKILSNKARFIKEQCDDNIDLRKKKRDVVINLLKEFKFDIIDNDNSYKYLRSMAIESVEEENYIKLMKERDIKITELEKLIKKPIKNMWLEELSELKTQYQKYIINREDRINGTKNIKGSKKIKVNKKKKIKKIRIKSISKTS
jgi:DNA topoisomerase-2